MSRIDPAQFDRHYPQLTYEAGLFMVAYLRRIHAEFGGDITAAIVLGEIAQHNVRPFREFDRETLAGLVELAERFRGVLGRR